MRPVRSFTLCACAIAVLSASPSALRAQFPADVQVGARVRVWLPEADRQQDGPTRRMVLRGQVESVSDDVIRLTVPSAIGVLEVSRTSLRRLDVSRGVSRPLSAAERAVGGAISGAVTYALMNDPRRSGGPHYRTDWRAAGVGAAWGGGIGAAIGLVFPHEHWRRVRLPRR